MREISKAVAIVLLALAPAISAQAQSGESSYRIYFGFQQSDMTLPAQDVADEIVKRAVAGGATQIDLVGTADNAESSPDELSLERAKAVQTYMIGKGLPDSVQVTVRGAGTTEPMVPNPPEPREPLNRNVSVTIH